MMYDVHVWAKLLGKQIERDKRKILKMCKYCKTVQSINKNGITICKKCGRGSQNQWEVL